jgi:hypothetical protein
MAKHTKTKTTNKVFVPEPANIIIGKHYSPKELAKLLDVTVPMLTHLRLTGRGPKFIKFGLRNVIYSAIEVEKYLKERERLSTSDGRTRHTRLAPYGT